MGAYLYGWLHKIITMPVMPKFTIQSRGHYDPLWFTNISMPTNGDATCVHCATTLELRTSSPPMDLGVTLCHLEASRIEDYCQHDLPSRWESFAFSSSASASTRLELCRVTDFFLQKCKGLSWVMLNARFFRAYIQGWCSGAGNLHGL
jgi:hypothetical protein